MYPPDPVKVYLLLQKPQAGPWRLGSGTGFPASPVELELESSDSGHEADANQQQVQQPEKEQPCGCIGLISTRDIL